MEKTVAFLENNKRKTFSLTEIKELELIPWARDSRVIARIIRGDFEGENMLKAEYEGRRCSVKGVNIRNYIKKYGPAMEAVQRSNARNKKRGEENNAR